MAVAVAACGDPAAVDEANLVRVTVIRDGEPAFHDVVFQDPDSRIIAEESPDGDGVVGAVMPAGGFVTVRTGAPVTYAGVKPGDHITYESASGVPISFPLEIPLDPGAADHVVYSTCYDGNDDGVGFGTAATPTKTARMFARRACPSMDVLIVSRTQAQVPLRTLLATDLPVAVDEKVTISGTYQPVRPLTLEHALPENTSVATTITLATPKGEIYSARTTGLSQVFQIPADPLHFRQQTRVVQPAGTMFFSTWEETARAKYTFDDDAYARQGFASGVRFDTAAHAITWTPSPDGATNDFSVAMLLFPGDGGQPTFGWQIYAPYEAGRIAFPVLEVPNFPMHAPPTVQFVANVSAPGGWDAWRPAMPSRAYLAHEKGGYIVGPSGESTIMRRP